VQNKTVEDFLNDEELSSYKQLKGNDARRIFIQEAGKKHFDLFVYILGYRDTGMFHVKQMENISEIRTLGDYSSRRLWLWARSHFKSSLITEAHSAYLIVNNPNIRILLTSYTISVAEKLLKNIKGHFISNADFRYFYREFCPQENTVGKIEFGTTEYFTTPARYVTKKEPTMMVAGVGTNLTGLHFDYQKIDDLVTRDSVTNETQIQTSKDYYASLRQLFDNPSYPKEDVIGTIYHFNDLYCDLRKSRRMVESYVPAVIEGSPAFPERFTIDSLNQIMVDVGPYEYATQYMLNPVNPADAKFRQEWVTKYDYVPDGLAEYIVCDPASTQKKKSDYTVMERWGVDNDGKHYLLEGIRDKLTSFQRVDRLFNMVKNARRLVWVKYEVLGGRHGDLEAIRKRQIETQIFFQINETKSTTGSKVDRIEQRLVAPYHAGIILYPHTFPYQSLYDGKVHDFVQEITLELLQFPFAEHDDCIDCQAQMFEDPKMIVKGDKAVAVIKKQGMTADDWEKFYSDMDKNKKTKHLLTNKQLSDYYLIKKFKKIISRTS